MERGKRPLGIEVVPAINEMHFILPGNMCYLTMFNPFVIGRLRVVYGTI